jgi:nitrilase
MPLARMALYEAGMQILCSPTWDKSADWLSTMQHIAREDGVFVISNAMTLHKDDLQEYLQQIYPEDKEWISAGRSCIINPNGKIIAGPLDSEEGLLIAEIDLEEIIAAKRKFDVVGHYARPDVFDLKIKN